jgi:hypothetical protein
MLSTPRATSAREYRSKDDEDLCGRCNPFEIYMKKNLAYVALVLLSFAISDANALSLIGTACHPSGNFDDGGGRRLLLCSNQTWQDVTTIDVASISLTATQTKSGKTAVKEHFQSTQWAGVPMFYAWASPIQPSPAPKTSKTPKVRSFFEMRRTNVKCTVVAFNPDHTAHVILDLSSTDTTGEWKKHIDTVVRVGEKTLMARDGTGNDYEVIISLMPV